MAESSVRSVVPMSSSPAGSIMYNVVAARKLLNSTDQ